MKVWLRLTSPHLTSPHLTSPHLTSPRPTKPVRNDTRDPDLGWVPTRVWVGSGRSEFGVRSQVRSETWVSGLDPGPGPGSGPGSGLDPGPGPGSGPGSGIGSGPGPGCQVPEPGSGTWVWTRSGPGPGWVPGIRSRDLGSRYPSRTGSRVSGSGTWFRDLGLDPVRTGSGMGVRNQVPEPGSGMPSRDRSGPVPGPVPG